MSTFLWVEDFEGNQYREFSSKLFARALQLEAEDFPDDKNDLKPFLEKYHIYLVKHFADARRFIADRLHDIDSIILDIDLNLIGEDIEADKAWVMPVLKRWHYDTRNKVAPEEELYNQAHDEMKRVAGYHLWKELVVEQRFPQEFILFCSNHAGHLKSLKNAFEPAKIQPPKIYTKDDPETGEWIAQKHADPYLRLRRWVVIGCQDILTRLRQGRIHFKANNWDKERKVSGDPINRAHAEVMLDRLPRILREHEQNPSQRRVMFRLLLRELTNPWGLSIDQKSLTPTGNIAHWVLLNVRNWSSHDGQAFPDIDEGDVAFLFMLTMRSLFSLSDALEPFEEALMPLVGEEKPFEMKYLHEQCDRSWQAIKELFISDPSPESSIFAVWVNELQKSSALPPDLQVKMLYQIFLHSLQWQIKRGFFKNTGGFQKNTFITILTKSLQKKAFE